MIFETQFLYFIPECMNNSGYPAAFKNMVNNAG